MADQNSGESGAGPAPDVRRRSLLAALGMGAAAALAWWGRPRRPDGPPAIKLASLFPDHFNDWTQDHSGDYFVRPLEEAGKVYGVYDQVLERVYVRADGLRVMLSVAYGGDQSPALQMHRPEVCYASGGYRVISKKQLALTIGGHSLSVTRVHAEMPGRPEPLTYWMVLGDEVVADAGSFRLRQLNFGLQRKLLDGMLVRISSIDPDPQHAWPLQARFADELVRAVPKAWRHRVIGRAA